jgi:hypothetical protein
MSASLVLLPAVTTGGGSLAPLPAWQKPEKMPQGKRQICSHPQTAVIARLDRAIQ